MYTIIVSCLYLRFSKNWAYIYKNTCFYFFKYDTKYYTWSVSFVKPYYTITVTPGDFRKNVGVLIFLNSEQYLKINISLWKKYENVYCVILPLLTSVFETQWLNIVLKLQTIKNSTARRAKCLTRPDWLSMCKYL